VVPSKATVSEDGKLTMALQFFKIMKSTYKTGKLGSKKKVGTRNIDLLHVNTEEKF